MVNEYFIPQEYHKTATGITTALLQEYDKITTALRQNTTGNAENTTGLPYEYHKTATEILQEKHKIPQGFHRNTTELPQE